MVQVLDGTKALDQFDYELISFQRKVGRSCEGFQTFPLVSKSF
jgi:hypothetical protein